jgi:hypothetical protein
MRVQFELNDEAVDYLNKLQTELHATSRGEVLRHAIAVLRWSADKIRDGYQILAMKEGESVAKELSNPLLDQVAPREHATVARRAESR